MDLLDAFADQFSTFLFSHQKPYMAEEEVNQDALQRLIDMCMNFERELGREVPGEQDNSCSDGESSKFFDGVSMKDML
ncbi:hypothetical protein BZG36_05682, partial [Bifiguratus adelaidae]